jgi:hypothetical protein
MIVVFELIVIALEESDDGFCNPRNKRIQGKNGCQDNQDHTNVKYNVHYFSPLI